MVLKGTYAGLTRRLDEAERRTERVKARGTGCAVCAGWGPICLRYPGEPWCDAGPASGYDDGGDPVEPWPEPARCPSCHREPELTIEVKYKEHDEPPVVHAADRAEVYERYAGDEPE